MILITGGLGFIGTHTARAFLDLGESCVLTQHRTARRPDAISDEIGTRVVIEKTDVADRAAVLDIGRRHRITGVVHLAGAGLGALGPFDDLRLGVNGLLNVLEAAHEWGVPRVSVASTIGVYGGVGGSPFREDMPLPMTSGHAIQAIKKSAEILSAVAAAGASFEVVNLRIAAIWGPLGRAASPFFAAPGLIHAAVRGEVNDRPVHAEDGLDMCYVKDCGRAIALLHTADKLNHRLYNLGTGRPTTNSEVAAAITAVIPGARIDLLPGRDPDGPGEAQYLDTTRIGEDIGFEPAYDVRAGVADYVDWLRSGHDR
jgi:UDP-glucose 4-epimerase